MMVFSWALTMTMLAVWVERWFIAPALTCTLMFLITSARPDFVFPAMMVANTIFLVVLIRVWFPRDTLAKMEERRQAIRLRARRWLTAGQAPGATTGPP